MSKILAHWELYRMVEGLAGHIVECGVFKGASLVRWATFRELTASPFSKAIIAFDTFGTFPESLYGPDVAAREAFVAAAGDQSLTVEQLTKVLDRGGIARNVELVAGGNPGTVPRHLAPHPGPPVSLVQPRHAR